MNGAERRDRQTSNARLRNPLIVIGPQRLELNQHLCARGLLRGATAAQPRRDLSLQPIEILGNARGHGP